MASVCVSVVRSAVLCAFTGLMLAPGAGASTGGAAIPGGELPLASDPVPVATTPAVDPANAEPDATVGTAIAPALVLPALANLSWKAGDPTTTDLAPLATPSTIAAVDGHVVVVRSRGGRSELIDLQDPSNPTVLLGSTRPWGAPFAGHNAAGHPVVVASPCAGSDDVRLLGAIPRCPLRAIDLITKTSIPLASTTGALAGDMEGDWLAFSRPSPATGVRLYAAHSGSVDALTLPRVPAPADRRATPAATSFRATALDVDARGRLAVVLDYAAKLPKYSSSLWLHSPSGSWKPVVKVTTPYPDLGARRVLGPKLDDGGVSAYVEGVVESPSYLARWSNAGAATTKTSLRRSIGRTTILNAAAYDGNRLLFEDWVPGAPCGAEEASACGLRAAAPVSVK